MESSLTLADIEVGSAAKVVAVRCDRALSVRLLEMGLVPGTTVEVRRRAPLGDPLELAVRGYALSLRRAEAARIGVVRVEASPAADEPASDVATIGAARPSSDAA